MNTGTICCVDLRIMIGIRSPVAAPVKGFEWLIREVFNGVIHGIRSFCRDEVVLKGMKSKASSLFSVWK